MSKADKHLMGVIKSMSLPPHQDAILSMLKVVKRNPKMIGRFRSTVAKSDIFSLFNDVGRPWKFQSEIDGEVKEHAACFSNPILAMRTWQKLSGVGSNKGKAVQIKAINSLKLFFDAALKGLPIYLNFKNPPDERHYFSINEIKEILLTAPWVSKGNQTTEQESSGAERELRRSRQGREIISTDDSTAPFSEIDFETPMTKYQMAGVFGTSENDITKQISKLVKNQNIDLDEFCISLDASDSKRKSVYYDPLIVFYIGYQSSTARGDEFRQWLFEMIYKFWLEKHQGESESANLKYQLEAMTSMAHELEVAQTEKDKAIDSLQQSLYKLTQEHSGQKRQIDELKNDLNSVVSWDLPISVMEAKQAAAAKYSSKLIFHARVDQSIEEFSFNQNTIAAVAAAKIFKAMADGLYSLKFEQQGFSEEKFRNNTGFALSMTESKASKRDQAIGETRKCFYNGKEVTFFPHIKEKVQGVDFRVHFQFLEMEKKIIICHVGEHLPNAKTKFLN